MRVVVTGSSGFIGRHVVKALLRNRYDVIGLDAASGLPESENFRFVRCNLLDIEKLEATFAEYAPQSVIHLAARTDLGGMNVQSYAANIEGVENLLQAVRNTPTVRRCLFTSSQLVCRVGYVPQHDQDYAPDTFYGESKVLTEQIVRQNDGAGTEWTIVRPTTIWGPGMSPHYQRFFQLVSSGAYFHMGSKPARKSYGYVGNTSHQYIKLLQAERASIQRQLLYLADYTPLALRDWANAFQEELGARRIRTLPVSVARVLAKTGDIVNVFGFPNFPFNSHRLRNILTEYQFDLSNTERICGPLPYTMTQGVHKTVLWLKREKIVT